jgi:hypothetical protein
VKRQTIRGRNLMKGQVMSPLEPAEELERTLEEPPAKRKPGWLKEKM